MTLHEVYHRAWAERRGLAAGWIVNLEPTYHLSVGAVGVVSGIHFNPETNLELRGVTGLQVDPNQRREDVAWSFQSNNDISIEMNSSAVTSGTAGAVGRSRVGLDVKFGRTEGASIYGSAMWWNGYSDLGLLRTRILEAARDGRLHKGESIVVTQQLTGPGVLFLAEGRNASLNASASVDLAPGVMPPISSLSGKLTLEKSSGGAQMQSFSDGSVLAARLLYLGTRGWLWWRKFEVVGALPLDADEKEKILMKPREGGGVDDYFALL
jgi:hypothetical protein